MFALEHGSAAASVVASRKSLYEANPLMFWQITSRCSLLGCLRSLLWDETFYPTPNGKWYRILSEKLPDPGKTFFGFLFWCTILRAEFESLHPSTVIQTMPIPNRAFLFSTPAAAS